MLRRFKKGNNWTKLVIVLSLMCSVFSIGAMAQKPMAAKALAGLITDLKEVVSRNSPNEKDAELVNARWDKRIDLKGKTKDTVINLLYDDVKAVIKDSGVQYQIYSIFSFTKQIPDEQFAKSEANRTTSPKKQIVENLVDLVFMSHPYINIEQELAKFPETKDVTAAKQADRKNRIEGFDAALKINNKLTSDQKKFVRANYDKLIKVTDKITEDAINLNFPTKQWIQEGLENIFAERFTVEEINNLTTFFASDKGFQVLKYIRQTEMEQLITGNGGKLDFTTADKSEHDKFIATPLGKKFIAAYITETEAFEKRKEDAARAKPNADGFAIYEPANLNKLFNKFVAENYKK